MHQGTCIKDIWTKPKREVSRVEGRDGWGRGAWWSENGDNCTSTTIKLFIRKS